MRINCRQSKHFRALRPVHPHIPRHQLVLAGPNSTQLSAAGSNVSDGEEGENVLLIVLQPVRREEGEGQLTVGFPACINCRVSPHMTSNAAICALVNNRDIPNVNSRVFPCGLIASFACQPLPSHCYCCAITKLEAGARDYL